jgi:hypothetical protein
MIELFQELEVEARLLKNPNKRTVFDAILSSLCICRRGQSGSFFKAKRGGFA